MLALLSGGLDSTLAVKMMLDQGVDVEGVNFTTPFCLCDKCAVDSLGKRLGIKIYRVFLGQEYLDTVANPTYGHGSRMNPCIDCRILMLKKAKKIASKIGATGIVTGEVLNERPFSQRMKTMLLIEREAGLEGKILRPLSARLLPVTEFEKNGVVNRMELLSIQGRRRLPQMRLAEKLGINEYPCPAGGCLLTDPQFSTKLKDLLKHSGELTLREVALLKTGRHLRVKGIKIIVGRNKEENQRLLLIANRDMIPYLEVIDYMSPITLLVKNVTEKVLKEAAAITVRYSDAPKDLEVTVKYTGNTIKTLLACAAEDQDIKQMRIQ
jgi:tRNA U34 2-thiouridine synthase MnmA/TrmU